ncbi:cold-regulated 413 inner membrane protein 1, chloroplastic isoform X2 [Ricinus communis]|uniref:cold-regulated 413 inner membrane protein 1, chloroplastic isoform X2 n=1 Tax=Ricinus communis TaxID=3988 RepID=UPI00201B00E1|nr:cold-regulated 413 inner membrane protein 1, chloroplastic isoform X2 [Ricinus communis]
MSKNMACLCISSAITPRNSFQKQYFCVPTPSHVQCKLSSILPRSSITFNPLRFCINKGNNDRMTLQKKVRRFGALCYAGPLSTSNLQWISTISSAGEYGIWTAFLALLVRLFFFIPGELELPFLALLLVLVAPYQVTNLRGTQEGATIGLAIAGYLAFQHFTRAGNLQKAFEQGSIVATLAIICVTVISCLFLF